MATDLNTYKYYISGQTIAILSLHEELKLYLTPTVADTAAIMLEYSTQVSTPTSVTDTIAIDDRLARALVYYVKMRLAEDKEQIALARSHEAEFFRNVARSANNKRGTRGRVSIPIGVGALRK